ncbi:MAG TPA: hypothetical protein VFP26_10245 [Gemmatimonadaceae bacterium]|jgi:hypothetical protein|nr:hypothetical protein [Gemmatimonadaceae bacterium]
MLKGAVHVLTFIGLAACASAGASSHPAKDYNVITQDEITAQNGVNAYDVISHLRPQYLKTRGRTTIQSQPTVSSEYASVFLDSQYFGDLNSLRNIASINIKEIRYLPANESVTRYGMQYGNGVIEIRTR